MLWFVIGSKLGLTSRTSFELRYFSRDNELGILSDFYSKQSQRTKEQYPGYDVVYIPISSHLEQVNKGIVRAKNIVSCHGIGGPWQDRSRRSMTNIMYLQSENEESPARATNGILVNRANPETGIENIAQCGLLPLHRRERSIMSLDSLYYRCVAEA